MFYWGQSLAAGIYHIWIRDVAPTYSLTPTEENINQHLKHLKSIKNGHLVSFNVERLYTNVPLD